MIPPSEWGTVQDAAYHLERAVTKATGTILLVGGGLVPQARALLREAGDWVQMAHKDVEALETKGKRRKAAQALALKSLKAAEKQGIAAAKLLFQEEIARKDVAAICAALAAAVEQELAALRALLDLRH